ncbi:MAG TPA: hypothetical protein VHW26_05750 [Solirubrobacteraceae bacterium]|nr:hypothetical protein [Solirubrobacteraceae bacterium]
MVPASYHSFFSGCASVAGALVGLLFVAVSISPEKLSGEQATTTFQIRAAAAFSVLINALVVTLFALLPDTNLGWIALGTSISGLGTTSGLLLVQLREPGRRHVRDFVFVVALVPLYTYQLVNAIDLIDHPASTDALDTAAVLVVVCFLIGIARAWELLGVPRRGLVHAAIATRRTGPAGFGPSDQIEPTDPSP